MIELTLCAVILVCVLLLYFEAYEGLFYKNHFSEWKRLYYLKQDDRDNLEKINKKLLQMLFESQQKLTRTNQPRDSKGRFMKKGR